MSVIGALKIFGICGLVVTVLAGTVLYDSRFTLLLLPAFLTWYSVVEPGWIDELPLTLWLQRLMKGMESTVGLANTRIMLVMSALGLAHLLVSNFQV
eukprot:TRINITY_DN68822_c0_g1_i1.p1 TRINITY_DN68822_c0_g1~~TRINITY_DN68822_c0_g1_i1.p1  ORF type:complete len:110 (+),score=13.05 TRINITY_DN68822_c0_g1_i1:42-332(+)